MKRDDRIDLIGLIARAMTSVEPQPAFRARVLASLPARRRQRWARLLVPVTVAVVIGPMAWLAGSVMRRTSIVVTTTPAGVVANAAESVDAAVAVEPIGRAARIGPVGSVEDLAWQARAVPRLVPAASLALESIQPNALSIAPITVEPVAPPDPIALAAIDSRAGGR